jgi:hypothetical protein
VAYHIEHISGLHISAPLWDSENHSRFRKEGSLFTELGRFSIPPARSVKGHEDQFTPPSLGDRCRFSQGTLARTHGNGRDAPIPDIPVGINIAQSVAVGIRIGHSGPFDIPE